MADVEKITTLQKQSSVAEDSLEIVFVENLDAIFTYSLQDVQSTLSPLPKPTLSRLHKTLCRQVMEVFAEVIRSASHFVWILPQAAKLQNLMPTTGQRVL